MTGFNLDQFEKSVLNLKFKQVNIDNLNVMAFTGKTDKFSRNEKFDKTKIVLHHTAGNIYGDLLTLTSPKMVSTAYVISHSGIIYNLFNPDFWSYHLGKGAFGGNLLQSRASIAIELSNYGWLHRDGDNLFTCYKDKQGKYSTKYCEMQDTHLYVETNTYRGQKYFCKYTDKQYDSLKTLLEYLCKRYQIPYNFLPVNERLELTRKVIDFKGIVTHVNYQQGKWDLSPAFEWPKIGG